MRNVAAFVFALLMPLGAWAEASNSSIVSSKLELGTRFGAGLMYVISDSEDDVYPSNGGLGGTLSFDVAYGLTEKLYLHSGVGLDYRNIFVYVEREFGCDYDAFEDENESYHHSISGHSEGFEYYQSLQLEIPLLLQWRIPRILFVEGGASLDVLFWNKTKGNMGAVLRGGDVVMDLSNGFGVNLIAGFGRQFANGLFLDFRTSFRINDLIVADRPESYGSYYKLLKFQLGVGYWF